MYLNGKVDYHNSTIAIVMSRNRFEVHMRYLHLADNNLHVGDKLAKNRNFLALINEICLLPG